ncbi:Stk1 family PASTA domain-containing Ser/Thr kinase [Nonomuraea phyllanthi]|uniref:non-specific serine/threonine protein kinase n=1 Tax=Nonomuraea phyllanthi TaxID=2219224 RepID=A0A5C4W9N2_9ACTN|nr:Stk1 family PASTA domain-containing Ser/Thr kinase [Nonomuraea phyllanthi]KAB8192827.1 Stk1 family PASTA domain-containing Ser/Thr kinase [Nonomuraea phyllanthi]QFY08305.1 Stk1 family PASTA domain-containing Ser/Thr kinase [Nonomuraea phyllanthi]
MDTTTADPLVGRLVDGRYRIESRIARGGMATVYLALDIRLDRTVALKVMHRSLAEDPAFVRRFIGEAKAVARLSHPNVVHVFDQGTDNDIVYLSMEYVPGRTLRDILRERGPLPAREALEIMIPVLAALGAAHQAGMVHRDVKPENVLMTEDGRVKVVDFGLARAIEATNQTRTGVLIGTVGYMAPEQVTLGAADVRSDVYAAGIMLFELVTGRQPYDGQTPMAVAYRHVHDTVPPPSSLVAEVPQLIDTLVAQATAREPADRPADATAMLVVAVDTHRMLPRTTDPSAPRPQSPMTSAASSMPHSPMGPGAPSTPYGTASSPHGAPSTPHGAASMPHATASMPQAAPSVPQAAPAHTLIQPREEAPRRRGGFRPNWFLVALAAVMVVAVGLTGWYFAQPETVTVPDLVGKNLELAKRNAVAAGLKVKEAAGLNDEEMAAGLVLRTDPLAETEVEKGTTITLVPSLGPKRIVVPKTAGMTGDDARAAIAAAGLTVGVVKRLANEEVERDKVIRTSPRVGEKVREGAKVDIYVSAGLLMPDVSGMPKDEAASYLGNQGFQVQVNEVDDDAEPCTVIAQTPKAKSEVDRGAQASITVARCQTDFWDWFRGDNEARDDQQFVVVPGVIGKNAKDAKAELEAQGFKVRVQRLGNRGVVQFQRPLPNSERPQGSTVYLWQ